MQFDALQLLSIERVNQHPLNQACKEHLPSDWRGNDSLHLLALIRLAIETSPPVGQFRDPDLLGLEHLFLTLEAADPTWALEYATTDESGESIIDADQLVGVDRRTAMYRVLEALHDSAASR